MTADSQSGQQRLSVPSAEHALLSKDAFERLKTRLRETGGDESWLFCRQLIAHEIAAALTLATDPALADKPGSLARATGALDALCQLSHRLQTL